MEVEKHDVSSNWNKSVVRAFSQVYLAIFFIPWVTLVVTYTLTPFGYIKQVLLFCRSRSLSKTHFLPYGFREFLYLIFLDPLTCRNR